MAASKSSCSKIECFVFSFRAANLTGSSCRHRQVKLSTAPHRRRPHRHIRFPHHFALQYSNYGICAHFLSNLCQTLLALSRYLAFSPTMIFVVINCQLDIRKQLISAQYPRLFHSLTRPLGPHFEGSQKMFVPVVAMLAVRIRNSRKRLDLIQSARNLLIFFSHLATPVQMSVVRHNIPKGCDVFRLPKLSASTAVLWSDIVI
jgi:hypothetical protein